MNKFNVGDKVRWHFDELVGCKTCPHCGSDVDEYGESYSDHVITEVFEHSVRGRSEPYYSYMLNGENYSVHESELTAIQ